MATVENNVPANLNGNGATKADKPAKSVTKESKAKANATTANAALTANADNAEAPKPTNWQTADKAKPRVFTAKEIAMVSNAEMDKAIVGIRKSGATLKATAHKTICGYMQHYVKHGDWTKLPAFLSAIRDAMSLRMANGLVKWVVAFSSLQYDESTRQFSNVKGQTRYFHLTGDANSENKWHKVGALNNPFYSTAFGDDKPHAFDAEKYIAKTLQNMLDTLAREAKRRETAIAEKRKADANRIKVQPVQIDAVKGMAKMAHVKLDLSAIEPANQQAA